MKIQILSDLHTEFWGHVDIKWLIPKEPADVLVLAGDIGVEHNIQEVLNEFKRYYPSHRTIYIPGNHEYYQSSFEKMDSIIGYGIQESCTAMGPMGEPPNLHVVSATLWFEDNSTNTPWKRNLNDFHLIEDFEPEVYKRNTLSKNLLLNYVSRDTIVVTHHLPSYKSVPKKYERSELNRFFVCDMEELILERKPKLWIHGHTHSSCDYMIGETRVICNPFGYLGQEENPEFKKHLIVEV